MEDSREQKAADSKISANSNLNLESFEAPLKFSTKSVQDLNQIDRAPRMSRQLGSNGQVPLSKRSASSVRYKSVEVVPQLVPLHPGSDGQRVSESEVKTPENSRASTTVATVTRLSTASTGASHKPEKKSFRDRAAEFLNRSKKSSKLSSENLAPEVIEFVSKSEISQTLSPNAQSAEVTSPPGNSPTPTSPQQNSVLTSSPQSNSAAQSSKSEYPVSLPASSSTGYRSSRMTLNEITSPKHTGYKSGKIHMSHSPLDNPPPLDGGSAAAVSTYGAMSTLRASRMSGILGVVKEAGKEGIDPKSAEKSFRQYFKGLLEQHDMSHKINLGVNIRPKIYKLSSLFGIRGEGVDPMDRLMWMSALFSVIKTDPLWIQRPDEASSTGTSSKNPNKPRVIDVDLESYPSGITVDSVKTASLSMIASGTLPALLDALILPVNQDFSYPEVFLASYRFFVSPLEVFDCLTQWYNATTEGVNNPTIEDQFRFYKKNIQTRCLRIMILWIKNHWHDFLENQNLFRQLKTFTAFLATESYTDYAKISHVIREERISLMTHQFIPMFPGIKETDSNELWCAEVDTDKFAHDLTLIDHLIFRLMKPDLYIQIMAKPGNLVSGAFNIPLKGIFDYCNWFRMVVSYPPTIISMQESTKKRTMSIRLFIKIAKTCLDLGNFQGAFAIIYGLKRPASLIWYSAWEALNSKSLEVFKDINSLMDHRNGYSAYWEAIEKAKVPAVPYLVPFFHDLVFLLESTPTYFQTDENAEDAQKPQEINFQKFYDMFSIAAQLEFFRMASYLGTVNTDKSTCGLLLQHIRFVAKQDDSSLGTFVNFAHATTPDDNQYLNSDSAVKNIKKIVSELLSGISDNPVVPE